MYLHISLFNSFMFIMLTSVRRRITSWILVLHSRHSSVTRLRNMEGHHEICSTTERFITHNCLAYLLLLGDFRFVNNINRFNHRIQSLAFIQLLLLIMTVLSI